LARLPSRYKRRWPWGASAEFLYRELIRSLDFVHLEEVLVKLAKSRPGPKRNEPLARLIARCRKLGFKVPHIQKLLEMHGINLSEEAVAAYTKSRRRPLI
jgi:hypothetical protein